MAVESMRRQAALAHRPSTVRVAPLPLARVPPASSPAARSAAYRASYPLQRRQRRSRRVEVILVGMALLVALPFARGVLPGRAGALLGSTAPGQGQAEAAPAGQPAQSGEARPVSPDAMGTSSGGAGKPADAPSRAERTGQVATVASRPPIAFSFTKFDADPALAAGAISTGVPSVSGDSAIVVDVTSGDVLYAKQPFKHHLMASTAKIMTAIVVAEHASFDQIVTVPQEATEVEPNHMGVEAGEKLTVQELLYGMLLDSGNDAAEALAYGAGGAGGRAQFVRWMNEKVAALGLKDTQFVNPSGLDDPDQYSSAYDLAVMGAYAIAKPELRKIFSTRDIVIPSSKEPGHEHGWFNPGNLNSLLTSYRGAFGIKPGYTEDAGYTLVSAAERDGRTLIAVTLDSRRHFNDAALLLDFGFAHPFPADPAPAAQARTTPAPTNRDQAGQVLGGLAQNGQAAQSAQPIPTARPRQ